MRHGASEREPKKQTDRKKCAKRDTDAKTAEETKITAEIVRNYRDRQTAERAS